jgi:glycosyltransferase involved in cell wall biosynthesis
VIPLGVDPPQCNSASSERTTNILQWVHGRPIVLFLSRIDPIKGLDILISASQKLRQSGRDFAVLIAGDGDENEKRRIDRMISAKDIGQTILRLGHVGNDKWQLLKAASVFVLPSHHENFGVSTVEALACGVPVVISDQVAVSSEVKAYGAGAVVPLDAGMFAEEIGKLLDDPRRRNVMSAAAWKCHSECFTWAQSVEQLEKLYDDCRI